MRLIQKYLFQDQLELYDLENDPHELENLAGKPVVARIERELKEQLAEWMILERDFLPLPTEP